MRDEDDEDGDDVRRTQTLRLLDSSVAILVQGTQQVVPSTQVCHRAHQFVIIYHPSHPVASLGQVLTLAWESRMPKPPVSTRVR